MNPLAQVMRARGHVVQGSDRAFDQGKNQEAAQILREQGIELFPQDGTAIHEELDLMVYSAAVETQTPEMQAAQAAGIRMQSRPHLLAELVNAAASGIAIAGTSGKSSVVGLIAWVMRSLSRPITVLGGAALAEDSASYMGCCMTAASTDPLLAEACESDGTLVAYKPQFALIHNITRDHEELDALREQFARFAEQSEYCLYNADCAVSAAIAAQHPRAVSYGTVDADVKMDVIRVGPVRAQATLTIQEQDYFIDFPQPGLHNLQNACAAMAVLAQLGVDLSAAAAAIANFPGVARRYQHVGTSEDNIRVIDDYAHNADKIRAVITAAQLSCDRLIAVFQPHGFGPARFLRPELKDLLPKILREQDSFCYAPIFYAGGTVAKDISSEDLAADLGPAQRVYAAVDQQALLNWVSEQAIPNATVLLMGARDPSLPALAKAMLAVL